MSYDTVELTRSAILLIIAHAVGNLDAYWEFDDLNGSDLDENALLQDEETTNHIVKSKKKKWNKDIL